MLWGWVLSLFIYGFNKKLEYMILEGLYAFVVSGKKEALRCILSLDVFVILVINESPFIVVEDMLSFVKILGS